MNIVVIYASRTGKCEQMAEAISEAVEHEGHKVDCYHASMVEVSYLKDYDLIFMGSSTYGDGEPLSEMKTLLDKMDGLDLESKRAAAFGCGSKRYPLFCAAVNIIESKLIDCNAKITADSYKIDGPVMFDLDYLAQWTEKIVR